MGAWAEPDSRLRFRKSLLVLVSLLANTVYSFSSEALFAGHDPVYLAKLISGAPTFQSVSHLVNRPGVVLLIGLQFRA